MMMQQPLNTPFGPFSTAEEVARDIDLSGKTAVVTGGASNLGKETVRVLSSMGANIVVPARDAVSASKALTGIERVRVAEVDLLDSNAVGRFASDFLAHYNSIDLLILSAGVMATPLFRDVDGREGQFATNHLGHFRLTTALWPALCSNDGARVVVLSSRGHQLSAVDLDDVDFVRRPYDKWLAYGQSKTANALFAVALDTRGSPHNVRAFSVHPGSILGPLARHLSRDEIETFGAVHEDGSPVIDPERDMKDTNQGAATTIWCASAPELEGIGSVYCEDADIAKVELSKRFGVRQYAINPETAEKLWALSVELTGLDLSNPVA